MSYVDVLRAIRLAGYFTLPDRNASGADRTICASRRRDTGGYAGSTFWIAEDNEKWILGTWSSKLYLFKSLEDFRDASIHLLSQYSQEPVVEIDKEDMARFNIIDITDVA